MTRRILFALLTFIIALVGGVALLTINAAGHDRASFTEELTDTTRRSPQAELPGRRARRAKHIKPSRTATGRPKTPCW